MITCKDFHCLIGLAVDGLLDGPDKAALEQHLTECAACRRKLADLTAIRAELARPVEAPDNLHNSIMNAVAAHEKQRRLRRMRKWIGSAAAALVLCLTVAGGMQFLGGMNAKSAPEAAMDMALAPGNAAPMAPAESAADTVNSDSVFYSAVQNKSEGAVQEPTAAPEPTPMPAPMPAPMPEPSAAHRRLLEGEGIAFAGAYAFNLFVEGDAEEIKKLLGASDSKETAQGYTVLEVSADFDAVLEQLKGFPVTEDARNGLTAAGEAPQTGLICIKNK